MLTADREGQSAVLDIINAGIPGAFSADSVFVTASVRQLLFDGVRVSCRSPQTLGWLLLCAGLDLRVASLPTFRPDQGDFLFSYFHHVSIRGSSLI